ncbi:hypothetical protein [Dyadobacter sp. CY351]|uniref:hypothetical protein n=1 Tax=Dyadobacter sp. CY351 TaxID=2909337 RepID=UPI001F46B0FB|nr:hypothetical protein [Dyadobacter sp. CY351]MCF2518337.1 hypothetical protein [Dyadobacter sp. CY351]
MINAPVINVIFRGSNSALSDKARSTALLSPDFVKPLEATTIPFLINEAALFLFVIFETKPVLAIRDKSCFMILF